MKARIWTIFAALLCARLTAQIPFEANGLRYLTLTRNGLTIMFAAMPSHVKEYSVMQVAISNGSALSWTVKPEDFRYLRSDGSLSTASPAVAVVTSLVDKASRHDVMKLVSAYEAGVYGNTNLKTTNGYEARRQSALANVSSARLKAAAAASAIVLVPTRLKSGESTDGAIFFPNGSKPLGPGKLLVHAAGEDFEFNNPGEPK